MRLHIVAPDAGKAVRKGENNRDEQATESEQPQFGEGFRQAGLGEVDKQRAVHRSEDREPAADRRIDHHLDRGHDADKRWRHEADVEGEHGATDRGEYGGDAEGKDLEVGDAITGEADPVFLVAHRDQNAAEFRVPDELRDEDANEQASHLEEIKHDLGVVRPDIPPLQGSQIGHAVDAAGVALLPDDQDRQDSRDRLRDDGEVRAADAALEHGRTDDEGEYAGNQDDRGYCETQAVERLPERRQRGDLIPVHEIGNAWGRLDLGVFRARCFELQKHRHAVAAEAKEHSLPQAENSAIPPANHQPESDEGIGEVFRDQIEPEDVETERKDHHQENGEHRNSDKLRSICETIGEHGFSPFCYLRTLRANRPCGRSIRIPTTASSVMTFAIDPDMKNSSVDCVCEMLKADAIVPSKLAAPPNTTTRKVSTM